ncbi:MAG: phosphodiester glycosidase family protein [Sandaracinaceae bacterium]|nr:phosphodiester glycosidase family protein [Sandaracinaceae bacterium]
MVRRSLALALLAFFVAPSGARAWPHEGREVGPGLIYRHFSGPIDIPGSGTSEQEIFVVYADLLEPRLRVVASAPADRGVTVSQFAERNGLAVAVNTNFFDGSQRACGLMASMGEVWSQSYDAGASCADSLGVSPGNEAVAFRSEGLRLGPLPDRVTDVATGMPFVVWDGAIVEQAVIEGAPNPSHMASAHPRSAVCLHQDGRTLAFVVVDGRATGRVGMRGITLGRFLFHHVGCRVGLNLDGGGSSTLFVRGEPGFGGRPAGVVNRTSDGSERRVCCHLGVRIGEPEPLFAAALVEGGGEVTFAPGEARALSARWRNTGRRAWTAEGPWPVRLGTADPRDRVSAFAAPEWTSASRLTDVPTLVAPGMDIELAVPLVAPLGPGEHDEAFDLVAEGATWMDAPVRYRARVVGPAGDAGPVEPRDAGAAIDAAAGAADAAAVGLDAGGGALSSDCACRLGAGAGDRRGGALIGLVVAVSFVRRRLRSGVSRPRIER